MTEDRRLPVSDKCPQCPHYGTVNVTKAELTEILSADKIDYFCPYCRTSRTQKLSQKDRDDFSRMFTLGIFS